MKVKNIKDDCLIEIFKLSREIQEGQFPGSGVRIWYKARIIEWLANIATELTNDGLKKAFLKWLDTDEEREYYKKIIY